MTFPYVIENSSGIQDTETMVRWTLDERDRMKDILAKAGAVLFRGFPVSSAEDFDRFSAAFGYRDFTYAESLSNA
ncbi:MAG: TauD/TfdA family dioxygenase, partial [Pseudomonadales bacterium]|nr:TauD/TfdA family dioxygenase [Pseudomonadales bacterium]